jgi:hypothetical protein
MFFCGVVVRLVLLSRLFETDEGSLLSLTRGGSNFPFWTARALDWIGLGWNATDQYCNLGV